MVWTLLSSLIGGILASLVGIFIWEHFRRPKLIIEVPEKIPGKEPFSPKIRPNIESVLSFDGKE